MKEEYVEEISSSWGSKNCFRRNHQGTVQQHTWTTTVSTLQAKIELGNLAAAPELGYEFRTYDGDDNGDDSGDDDGGGGGGDDGDNDNDDDGGGGDDGGGDGNGDDDDDDESIGTLNTWHPGISLYKKGCREKILDENFQLLEIATVHPIVYLAFRLVTQQPMFYRTCISVVT